MASLSSIVTRVPEGRVAYSRYAFVEYSSSFLPGTPLFPGWSCGCRDTAGCDRREWGLYIDDILRLHPIRKLFGRLQLKVNWLGLVLKPIAVGEVVNSRHCMPLKLCRIRRGNTSGNSPGRNFSWGGGSRAVDEKVGCFDSRGGLRRLLSTQSRPCCPSSNTAANNTERTKRSDHHIDGSCYGQSDT